MSGTDIAYAAICRALSGTDVIADAAIRLLACYAQSGTDMGYAARRSRPFSRTLLRTRGYGTRSVLLSAYACAMRCPVLRCRVVLCGLSAYATAMRWPVLR
eukprot:3941441-Rhodomonas_salina.3